MVKFGSYTLPHAYQANEQNTRLIVERLTPSASVPYRADDTAGGRVLTIIGEIRDDPDYMLRLEEIAALADDVARALDLEDGSATINAKLGNVTATWTADAGLERPAYQAEFWETS
jgi:hypothetical protein